MGTPAAEPAVSNPVFGRVWALAQDRLQPAEVVRQRRTTLAGLTGRVLEVGAGSGTNFALYPPTVDEVVAVEPEPWLRRQARRAAATAPVPVRVVDGTAERTGEPDGAFDAAVCCFVLCTVPDPDAALAAVHRALRPGGVLRFCEHVAAGGARGRVQRAVDATFWPHAFGGCHTHRDTVAAIRRAGFVVEREDVSRADGLMRAIPPVAVHALGEARRP